MHIVSVGEAMVELSPEGPGLLRRGFAGDTLNTAWYLRAVLPATASIAYVTTLGQDALSQAMQAFMQGAGIDTSAIRHHPDRVPGIYMIEREDGERSFTYWRDNSAARCLADDPAHLRRAFCDADLVYFSGITLAILPPDRRAAFIGAVQASLARVAFDPNLRPALWENAAQMRDWTQRAARIADIVLPGFDDEARWFGDATPAATARRYRKIGATEVMVKNAGGPMAAIGPDDRLLDLPVPQRVQPIDTTAAGDSFNAAYLAARLQGRDIATAAGEGHALAIRVIAHHGALVAQDTP